MAWTDPITEPQIAKITQLADQLEREIAPGSLQTLTRKEASDMISDMIGKTKTVPQTYVPQTSSQYDNPVIGKGYYTVVDDYGHRTFRVSPNQTWCDGKTVVSVLSGSNNEWSYTGVGFVTATGITLWKKFKENTRMAKMLDRLVADAQGAYQMTLEMAKQHVLTSTNCFVCGKLLTDPTSIEMGIGPVCREAIW
jgi:hypothetical protein